MNDISVRDPERRLACLYAARGRQAALQSLWALDEQLADLLRHASDPIVGQIRYTWWHDALTRLDDGPPPAQPLLQGLFDHLLPLGISGAMLAEMIDGWEILLDRGSLDAAVINVHAGMRGRRLFVIAAGVIGASADDPVVEAGKGWALIDLAVHLRDPEARALCFAMATPVLEAIVNARWSATGRPLGMLAQLAIIDCRHGPEFHRHQGSPRRLLRMLQHRLTGR